ncbi:LmbE family N-acetylglucosaminyl deacetylase [Rhodococcus sp. OK519]|uniref:PIG-L deacetylase family protein n=1 Tax=Rhodococcus sp. OK519 TaxID=2135729 RepID=UPI000D472AF7|nr:LmbE family N-acetylglucosaminyl deacetylase [Rhodococcus sp. OK519]
MTANAPRISHPRTTSERFGAVPVEAGGTPESEWAGNTSFAHLDVHTCPELLVAAPHPDDEVLGVGALASELAARGTPVSILSVTDGEASHPDSPTVTPDALAAMRRTESERAAQRLGLPAPDRLGLPDGSVSDHEKELAEMITERLRPGAWCAAPYRHDGHPDHESVGRAAAYAARQAGAVLIEYPIWLWHWSYPLDPSVPWHRARTFHPTGRRQRLKRDAVAEFTSQTADLSPDPADRAILPPRILDRLLRDHETVFVP